MRTLVELSALWKANQQHGFCVTLDRSFGDLEAVLQSLTDRYQQLYDEAARKSRVAELLTELHTQLETLALDKSRTIPLHNQLSAIGHIWLLDYYGFIDPDDFNGLLLEFDD